jgi:hypothetical protein
MKRSRTMTYQDFASCIDACNACATACEHCTTACLAESDPGALARCIELDIDCAQACRLAAAYMGRGSEMVTAACALCAQLCEACEAECAQHDMEHCEQCAEACRRCAQECRQMSPGPGRQTGTQATAHH